MIDDDGVLPPHLERQLDQMGVFNDDLEDDPTLNITPKKGLKKEREKDRYAMPEIEFDENGEPNF